MDEHKSVSLSFLISLFRLVQFFIGYQMVEWKGSKGLHSGSFQINA